ncbi:MAG: PD-(D/E)XK nuclease family protein, partial [Muribaculaceae bacterium]|nr:PD-(D/E)XK nuclease family protein [Muribaculaceae bacterium]
NARNKFIYLWQILSPLYDLFTHRLDEAGLATPGRAYRLAKERLEEFGHKILPCRKVVMVGYNALSASERGIFAALRDMDFDDDEYDDESFADFVWDSTGPILSDRDNPAGRFVAVNRKKFPEPAWLKPFMSQSETYELPEYMEQIASPSNALQAKIAGEELKEMYETMERQEEGSGDKILNEARVAVILPDESLLIPVLYGLPSVLGAPNLTMGYPLKETSLSTFVALLRHVQTTQRYSKGERGFGTAEIYRFFAHPLTHAILSTSAINRFKNDMISRRRIVVSHSDIKEFLPRADRLLYPLSPSATIAEVSSYMKDVLDMVADAMSVSRGILVRNSLEYQHARLWQEALSHLTDVVSRYGVEMKPATFFYEAERLLSGETVPFTGVPLEGLQIMGLLETRLLDFEHIIVLSMNDKIMPQRARQRTFIPDSLRRGYGMPPSNYQESIFSYYFYRLISRAKTVRLVYDSRVGLSGGGPSRYLHQLDMLYARGILKHSERKLPIGHVRSEYESSGKNENTQAILERYKAGAANPKVFSATSLKKYCVCPLKFYLEVICGIKTDKEDGENMSAIMYGDIFHKLMELVYMPEGYSAQEELYETPIRVTREKIEKLLDDRDGLHRMVCRTINQMFYKLDDNELDTPLPPATSIIAEGLLLQLESALKHDLQLSPFELLGCETGGDLSYQVNDDLTLNVRFKIDRIDRVSAGTDESGNEIYEVRLVDYKT